MHPRPLRCKRKCSQRMLERKLHVSWSLGIGRKSVAAECRRLLLRTNVGNRQLHICRILNTCLREGDAFSEMGTLNCELLSYNENKQLEIFSWPYTRQRGSVWPRPPFPFTQQQSRHRFHSHSSASGSSKKLSHEHRPGARNYLDNYRHYGKNYPCFRGIHPDLEGSITLYRVLKSLN